MNSILTLDYESALLSLKKALEIDSTFTFATFYIAYAYAFDLFHHYQPKQRNTWIQQAYNPRIGFHQDIRIDWICGTLVLLVKTCVT